MQDQHDVLTKSQQTFFTQLGFTRSRGLYLDGYPLLENPRPIQGVQITGLKDISAMKIIAIAQRGRRRDFIDIYYLLQQFSLKEILRFTHEKYSHFDIYHGLRGLLYFEDADHDPAIERSMVFDRTLRWQKVKHCIIHAVKEFQKSAT